MNASVIARQYGSLTPEERFRLILAASGRGDEAERDRLAKSGGRITLSFPDPAPFAQAFDDLSWLTLIELLDDAAEYLEAFSWAATDDDENDEEDDGDEVAETEPEGAEGDDPEGESECPEDEPVRSWKDEPAWLRSLDISFAQGFLLK